MIYWTQDHCCFGSGWRDFPVNEDRQLELQRKTNHKKEEYKYFVGTTRKHALGYRLGEKIVFKIRVKYMDDYLDIPYIQYILTGDDGQSATEYLAKAEDGPLMGSCQVWRTALGEPHLAQKAAPWA